MSWTDERIQELTRLWQQGLSASEIGKRLGISKNAVVGKAHRLKLPSRPSPIKHTPARSEGGKKSRKARLTAAPRQEAPAQKAAVQSVKQVRPAAVGTRAAQRSQAPRNAGRVEKQGGHRGGCLWPIGDPGDADFHFCGAEAMPGKPYCAEHAARAYITRSRERDEEAA